MHKFFLFLFIAYSSVVLAQIDEALYTSKHTGEKIYIKPFKQDKADILFIDPNGIYIENVSMLLSDSIYKFSSNGKIDSIFLHCFRTFSEENSVEIFLPRGDAFNYQQSNSSYSFDVKINSKSITCHGVYARINVDGFTSPLLIQVEFVIDNILYEASYLYEDKLFHEKICINISMPHLIAPFSSYIYEGKLSTKTGVLIINGDYYYKDVTCDFDLFNFIAKSVARQEESILNRYYFNKLRDIRGCPSCCKYY